MGFSLSLSWAQHFEKGLGLIQAVFPFWEGPRLDPGSFSSLRRTQKFGAIKANEIDPCSFSSLRRAQKFGAIKANEIYSRHSFVEIHITWKSTTTLLYYYWGALVKTICLLLTLLCHPLTQKWNGFYKIISNSRRQQHSKNSLRKNGYCSDVGII